MTLWVTKKFKIYLAFIGGTDGILDWERNFSFFSPPLAGRMTLWIENNIPHFWSRLHWPNWWLFGLRINSSFLSPSLAGLMTSWIGINITHLSHLRWPDLWFFGWKINSLFISPSMAGLMTSWIENNISQLSRLCWPDGWLFGLRIKFLTSLTQQYNKYEEFQFIIQEEWNYTFAI